MTSNNFDKIFLVREVSAEELNPILEQHFEKVYGNRDEVSSSWDIEDHSKMQIGERRKNEQRFRLRLMVFEGSNVVGWHFGYSTDAETYYMQNSAILPEYRNLGAYSQLLEVALKKIAEQGFQVVVSTHHPNNAAVLIPKLKKGFIVSGMQVHERFRFLIELKYFFNEKRRKSFGRTIGLDLVDSKQ